MITVNPEFWPSQTVTCVRLPYRQTQDYIDALLAHCQQQAQQRQGHCMWVAYDGALLSNLRGWENLLLPATFLHVLSPKQAVAQATALLQDDTQDLKWLSQPAVTWRPAQRVQLALARAILVKPLLTIIDANILNLYSDKLVASLLQHLSELSAIVYVLTENPRTLNMHNLVEEFPFAVARNG